MKDEYRLIAQEWFSKAESDYNFAKSSFEEFDDFYSQMCLLCHDAAEKYLKAYIISSGNKPERIHDLVALLNECVRISNKAEFQSTEDYCRLLNRYYIPLKYPSHYPLVTKKQAKAALESVEKVRDIVRQEIE